MTPETLSWTMTVTFSQIESGKWMLSEMDITPNAAAGVFDAIARLCAILAAEDGPPINGGYWGGAP